MSPQKNPATLTAKIATVALALSGGAFVAPAAAGPIYSNGSPDPAVPSLPTGTTSASGVPSPLGTQWSELQGASVGGYNAVAGFSAHQLSSGGPYRLGDNFSVFNPYGWRMNTIVLYAYAPGSTDTSPVAGVNLRIWSSSIGGPGSAIVFGDTFTNRMLSATPSPYYRVFASAATPSPMPPTQDRRLWEVRVDVSGLLLMQGLYWIDWQFIPAAGVQAVYSPATVNLGQRARAGSDAIQYRTFSDAPSAWVPILDEGRPTTSSDVAQELAFMVDGIIFCPADFDGSGGTPDSTDIEAFFAAWLAGDAIADVDLSGGTPDTTDIEVFFQLWLAGGC